MRMNAVHDLTTVPGDTPLRIHITFEFKKSQESQESPLYLSHTFCCFDRVQQVYDFLSVLVQNTESLVLLYQNESLSVHNYLYEYNLTEKTLMQVILE